MEFNEGTILELKESWKTLYKELKKNKKLKFEQFEETFSKTYLLLSEHAANGSLDKQYIHLIAEAYLFASIKDNKLESICLAATVLTERMLNSFAFHTAPEGADTSVIYILEAHEEIKLDFKDVNQSISDLTQVYDNADWNKMYK